MKRPAAFLERWGQEILRPFLISIFFGITLSACATEESAVAKSNKTADIEAPTPLRQQQWMISAAHPLASEAGRDVLREGGSAVDAAIAAQMVLNLVEPQSSGIGGGAFLTHFDAKNGDIDAYDGRETAPSAADDRLFLDDNGDPTFYFTAINGGLAVGVPGLLRMLKKAHKKHGRLSWASLFSPAIRLAEDGFPISPRFHKMVSRTEDLKKFPQAKAYFFDSDGQPKAIGSLLTNRPLAETFKTIAKKGPNAFYSGKIAQDIVKAVRGAPENPGRLTFRDMASYQAKNRAPVCAPYRAWLVCGPPPPSSGGISVLQILGLLQNTDLSAMKPFSAEAVHAISEASRLAFADRNVYIADPDFIPVPTGGLLDPGYLALRARDISSRRSMGIALPGMPGITSQNAADTGPHGISTTHLSVVDAKGNAVSMTSSIGDAYGSRLMVDGFMLNSELADFSFRPSHLEIPIANRVEAKKRPRSSMAPTLVFDGSGKLVLAIGSPGGSNIIGYVAKTIIAVLDWNFEIEDAINLPHFLNKNGATFLEAGTPLEGLRTHLEFLGHQVIVTDMVASGLHGILVNEKGLSGGADKRREGVALGN
jgi:gamma-glutamyltranspeptidase / glutathione hydrolase